MLYFTSDTHFNHTGIMTYCAATRPYADVDEMNEAMIANWNAVVGPKDTIYVVGDFAFNKRKDSGMEPSEIFRRLNGHKHLVIGNHDEKNPASTNLPWMSKWDIRTLKHTSERDGQSYKFILCHYPMETWKDAQKGSLMIHGHSHGSLKRVMGHRYDVGVDAPMGPHPISAEIIIEASRFDDFIAQDHHGD